MGGAIAKTKNETNRKQLAKWGEPRQQRKGKGLLDEGGGVRTEVEGGHLAYLPRQRQPSQRAVVDAKRKFRPRSRPHPRL